ncbi:MAG: hypothetical protein QF752_10080 [Planctomycetota bacterium]|jgi:RNA polymerase sigma-70 factor (ECF subfamily)|nr:hypothetical protein [Planctomycetota bacterium]
MLEETLHQKSLKPFPETSWTIIHECQDPAGGAHQAHLDSLFRRYWPPVYSYVYRNWTQNIEEAKDHTQAFFTAFMEKDFLKTVDADRGRFRNFVCVALRHFLSKRKRAARAKKRYPDQGSLLSLEGLGNDESVFDVEDTGELDPQKQFDADWKCAVIGIVLERLRELTQGSAKSVYVDLFVEHDLYPPDGKKPSYQELCDTYSLSLSQVKNGLHWSRKEFKAHFLRELRDQVSSPEDLEAEAWELYGLKI